MAQRDPDAELQRLMPEGKGPPDSIPPDIFSAALDVHLAGNRIDMQALAERMGISRSTLYRKAGPRDRLLGEVIWFLARMAFARILPETTHLRGRERVLEAIDRFIHMLHGHRPFRRLLAEEPEAALRVLTSQQGPVQAGVVAVTQRTLDEEGIRGPIEQHTLAFVIVRIVESFLYADVIAGFEPDLGLAVKIIDEILPR